MPQSGGSAMMYGVLYQLLGAAHWAANVRLRTTVIDDTFAGIFLVIEPTTGGDLQVHAGGRRIVEQWKAKSDEGAWSLRQIIEDVFPDLFRAVEPLSNFPTSDFHFVTEGHRGRWGSAESFFAEIREVEVPADPVSALDDKEQLLFLPGQRHTRRGFFREILSTLRAHPDIGAEPEANSAKKLWHLLCHFKILGDRTAEKLERELHAFLLPLVDYREQVEPKRRELIASLLELAASGNATFSPRQLLERVELSPSATEEWAGRREALIDSVQIQARTRWRYVAELDVRPPPKTAPSCPVIVLCGESGQGKTWRLASLALDCFAAGSLAVAISATGSGNDDRTQAAKIVSRAILGHEAPTDLDLVAAKKSLLPLNLSTPWLTVCIDDVSSVRHARSLIEWNWRETGIRLAISTLSPIARALKTQYGDAVELINVEEFRTAELREYLEFRGHDWAALPIDMRVLLRKPLLARLYCDIAASRDWWPLNEYSLFDRFWVRIRDDREQADHPGDTAAMCALAAMFLDAGVVYPWPHKALVDCGIDPERFRRLEGIGWLRRLDDDRVEISHDRLLNWAIAESLVAKRVAGELNAQQLASTTAEFNDGSRAARAGRLLAYIPMDVCWLLGDPQRGLTGDLPLVVKELEDKRSAWSCEQLYVNLLPTLGPRIIHAVVDRLRTDADSLHKDSPLPGFAAKTITAVGQTHKPEATELALRLLKEKDPALQNVGIWVLAKCPDSSALDRLWELHRESRKAVEKNDSDEWWIMYDSTFAALKACTQSNPNWLEQRVLSSSIGSEPFSELAYLVANQPGARGRELWHRIKGELFVKVPLDKARSLVTCIQQHSDVSEIDKLQAWLFENRDLASELAFSTLVRLAPAKALEALRELDVRKLYLTRNWWLSGLLLRYPDETRAILLDRIQAADKSNKWQLAYLYSDDPDQMDEATLDTLLDELTELFQKSLEEPSSSTPNELYGPAGLLAEISARSLLKRFESRAGSNLEVAITRLACQWGGREGISHDYEVDFARRLLSKIGGEGITQVINTYLKSESRFARLDGIELCLIRPNAETRAHLRHIACEVTELWAGTDQFPLLQTHASVALAVLGENSAVIQSILRWGLVLNDLAEVRRALPQMGDEELSPAMALLEDLDQGNRTRAIWALSVSGRVDYAERLQSVFREAPPESDLALACVVALDDFADGSSAALSLLKSQLLIEKHAHAAVLALLSTRSPDSLAILEQELRRRGYQAGLVTTDLLVANLAMRKESRRTVAEVVWKAFSENGSSLDSPHAIECLAELDDPLVTEFLVEESFASEKFIRMSGQKAAAIRALVKSDRDSAFRACERALRFDRHDREKYPAVLMDIDELRAIPILANWVLDEQSAAARHAIGRALRAARAQSAAWTTVMAMLESDSPEKRRSGAELSSWLHSPAAIDALKKIAITDSDNRVRQEAELGIGRLLRHEACLELLSALESSTGCRSWSYLEAAINLGDPVLLSSRSDILWLGAKISKMSPGIHRYARKLVKRQSEKLEKDEETEDRNRDRD